MVIRELVRPLPGVRKVSLLRQKIWFTNSARYWEENYSRGGTSGGGSYGALACGKAEFLNTFVRDQGVESIIEFGCGDGHQLSLATYPRYVGLDVSRTAIQICKKLFAADLSKSFFLYEGTCFVDPSGLLAADLAISLDVVYHLIEDPVYESYMSHLFGSSRRYVVVYATNHVMRDTGPHVRHRNFTAWVDANCPQWRLTQVQRGPDSGPGRADFFVFQLSIDP